MNYPIEHFLPALFPVFFVLLWILATSLLGFKSGWYNLMKKFPDRPDVPLLSLHYQSGNMGEGLGVNMNRILNLSVCPSGLRIGMMRIFGLFSRNIFVPWNEIKVERRKWFFMKAAELRFGEPSFGKLIVLEHVANRLARSALSCWPEKGEFPEETKREVFMFCLKFWALGTGIGTIFFTGASYLATLAHPGARFPIGVTVLSPAVIFFIVNLLRYISRTRG